jgi:hypothetical protein
MKEIRFTAAFKRRLKNGSFCQVALRTLLIFVSLILIEERDRV